MRNRVLALWTSAIVATIAAAMLIAMEARKHGGIALAERAQALTDYDRAHAAGAAALVNALNARATDPAPLIAAASALERAGAYEAATITAKAATGHPVTAHTVKAFERAARAEREEASGIGRAGLHSVSTLAAGALASLAALAAIGFWAVRKRQ